METLPVELRRLEGLLHLLLSGDCGGIICVVLFAVVSFAFRTCLIWIVGVSARKKSIELRQGDKMQMRLPQLDTV